jgi:translocation and assembly module TamB
MRRLGKWLLALLAATLIGLSITLSTHVGQSGVLRLASLASDQVQIDELTGSLFGDGAIAAVRLSDRDGAWLDVRGISFAWTPSQLLAGRLDVAHIRVESVTILRRPASSADTESGDGSAMGLPLKIAIGELSVKAITLAAPVVGEPVTLRLAGNTRIGDATEGAEARLRLQRLDGAKGHLTASFAVKPGKPSLDIEIQASEPAGGLVAGLLGLPAQTLSARLSGTGPIDAWAADLAIETGEEPILTGSIRLDATSDDTHHLSGRMAGSIGRLMPVAAAELLAERIDASIDADLVGLVNGAPQQIRNARIAVNGHAMQASASGGLDLTHGSFHGAIDARVGRSDGKPLRFASGDGRKIELRETALRITAPEQRKARQITATAEIKGLDTGAFAAEALALSGRAIQLDPSGAAAGIFRDIRVALSSTGIDQGRVLGKVVGHDPSARLTGDFDQGRLTIHALELQTSAAHAHLAGAADRDGVKGRLRLSIADLSRYAELAARPLTGSATFEATIDGRRDASAFVASLLGESTGVGIGMAQLDGLLVPRTTYETWIERLADGSFSVRDATIASETLSAKLNAKISADTIAAKANLRVLSLEAAHPDLRGRADMTAEISGTVGDLNTDLRIFGSDVALNNKPLENPMLAFRGRGPLSQHEGKLTLGGRSGQEVLDGTAKVFLSDTGHAAVQDLVLEAAGARLDGGVAIGGGTLPSGRIRLDAQNLARLGNAIGLRLKGRINAELALTGQAHENAANITVSANDIVFGDVRVAAVRTSGHLTDYLTAPIGTINASISGVAQGARQIGGLSLQAQFNGQTASATAKGKIDNGLLEASAHARIVGEGHEVKLSSLSYIGRSDLPPVRLAAPAVLMIGDGMVRTKSIRISIEQGTVQIEGAAGADEIDAKIALQRLPLSMASVAVPELGLEGVLGGTVNLRGKPSDPQLTAKLTASGLSTRDSRSSQLPSANITADVTTVDRKAQIKVIGTAKGGLELALTGSAGLNDKGAIALAGRGVVPLGLANVFLADRATRVTGSAKLAVDIAGQIDAPRVDGTITVEQATIRDAELGLELKDIAANIGFTQEQAVVRRLTANSAKGGSISAEGAIRLRGQEGPALEATAKLASFKFGNQDPVAGTVNGDVTVSGPLSAPAARGHVLIERMDITVPNGMPKSVSALDIRHINAPARFQSTAPRQAKPQSASPAATPISLAIDVTAHDRIFVRGRGVDAQLGGAVRVRGTAQQPFTDGQFTMSRGRLAILGRQLDFSRGVIAFAGNPEPLLDLEAQADADGTRVIVKVTGPASSPELKFTSSPELPEDEVVALLLFNKKLAKLSAAQLIQLAGEIDKIGGLSSGPGTLDKMKSALGVDVLDVTTDEKGNAQATAGSYINDKTYIGVKQGMTLGKSRIVVDHDLMKNLKARGEVGTDGDSKLGLGFEFDY